MRGRSRPVSAARRSRHGSVLTEGTGPAQEPTGRERQARAHQGGRARTGPAGRWAPGRAAEEDQDAEGRRGQADQPGGHLCLGPLHARGPVASHEERRRAPRRRPRHQQGPLRVGLRRGSRSRMGSRGRIPCLRSRMPLLIREARRAVYLARGPVSRCRGRVAPDEEQERPGEDARGMRDRLRPGGLVAVSGLPEPRLQGPGQ